MSLSTRPRTLITGIDSFTGRYLAPQLTAAGHEVFGTTQIAEYRSDYVFLSDLTDRESISKILRDVSPDFLINLAAISFVPHGSADDIYTVNLLGAQHLLQAVANSCPKISKILLVSSANVYGNVEIDVIHEQVPPVPANDYAVSKLSMEYMARLWFERLPIIITRPFNYTGIGQSERFLIPKIVAHFRRRIPDIELGNLDVERDISDVRMVVDCYRRLLETPTFGEIVNVCSGIGYSLSGILKMATEITGHRMNVVVNPAFVRDNEVRRLVGTRRHLESMIGQVSDYPLSETLQWMLADKF